MKRVRVGVYPIGLRNVELWALVADTSGGSFTLCPEDKMSQMEVGIGYKNWWECHAVLLHEALEAALVDVSGRYKPSPDYATANDGYLFCVTHPVFSEAVARASYFVSQAQNQLAHAQRKYRKSKP